MVQREAELRVAVHALPSGARVLDAGFNVPGGFAAGLALAELCMGGLGHAEYASLALGADAWPGVHVWTITPPSAAWPRSTPAGRSTRQGFSDGFGPTTGQSAGRVGALRKIGLLGGRDPRRARARRAVASDRRMWRRGSPGKAGVAPDALTFAVAPTASPPARADRRAGD